MGLERKIVQQIKKEFYQEYVSKSPFNNYVNGSGLSTLKVQKEVLKKQLNLKSGESLDDWCLTAYLREQPPENINLPSEYKGVRVFYTVIGKIIPHKSDGPFRTK